MHVVNYMRMGEKHKRIRGNNVKHIGPEMVPIPNSHSVKPHSSRGTAYNNQVRTYHILFIRSSVDGRLGYFYLLAMVNNAAMSTGVANTCSRPCFQFFCYVPKSGKPCGNYIFHFFRDYYSVFHSSCIILHFHQHDTKSWTRLSNQHYRSVPISPLLGQHLFSRTFVFVCILAILMVVTQYLIVFLVCIFLIICDADHLFSYTYWPCVYLSTEISLQVLCPFLNWVILLLLIFRSSSYTLDINPLSGTWYVNIFSH